MAAQPSPLTDEEEEPDVRERVRETIRGATDRVLDTAAAGREIEEEMTDEVAAIIRQIGSGVVDIVRQQHVGSAGWHVFAFGLLLGFVLVLVTEATVVWALISLRLI